ncbi:hypothetical protein [Actinomadura sp. 3N508]|uniref:hypothetical protein n=1 Tax=Actinomadura sp. 3N508 TaxID=3375153 RepID=UPI0037B5E210
MVITTSEADGTEGEEVWCLGEDVDALLGHRLDNGGIDDVGGRRSGQVDLDGVAGAIRQPC